jgi:hypothetical protein
MLDLQQRWPLLVNRSPKIYRVISTVMTVNRPDKQPKRNNRGIEGQACNMQFARCQSALLMANCTPDPGQQYDYENAATTQARAAGDSV